MALCIRRFIVTIKLSFFTIENCKWTSFSRWSGKLKRLLWSKERLFFSTGNAPFTVRYVIYPKPLTAFGTGGCYLSLEVMHLGVVLRLVVRIIFSKGNNVHLYADVVHLDCRYRMSNSGVCGTMPVYINVFADNLLSWYVSELYICGIAAVIDIGEWFHPSAMVSSNYTK